MRQLIWQYDVDFDEMKQWYDGYSFSGVKSVYSPNSVMEAITREEFGSYWTRTETKSKHSKIEKYMKLNVSQNKES